jgi:hypothetical protein
MADELLRVRRTPHAGAWLPLVASKGSREGIGTLRDVAGQERARARAEEP